jgi:hypothetical protein
MSRDWWKSMQKALPRSGVYQDSGSTRSNPGQNTPIGLASPGKKYPQLVRPAAKPKQFDFFHLNEIQDVKRIVVSLAQRLLYSQGK